MAYFGAILARNGGGLNSRHTATYVDFSLLKNTAILTFFPKFTANIPRESVFLQHQSIRIMTTKKTAAKTARKTVAKPRKRFKFIKGCMELVKDPFNLN